MGIKTKQRKILKTGVYLKYVATGSSAVPEDYLLELSFTVLSHKIINLYSKFKVVLKVNCSIDGQYLFFLLFW